MPRKSISLEDQLKAINATLYKVTIRVRGKNMLYLRATLPPKPGKTGKRSQQEIPVKAPFTEKGLALAKKGAARLDEELISQPPTFTWDAWGFGLKQAISKHEAGYWVDKFLQWKGEKIKPSSLKSDYAKPLAFISRDSLLTEDLLIGVATGKIGRCKGAKVKDSRCRKGMVRACKALGAYAGLEIDWGDLAGKYKNPGLNPQDLPTDEEIVAIRNRIGSIKYQWVYGMLATYGLRPHEIFHLDMSRVKSESILRVLEDTKTGSRLVWPRIPEWVEEFKLWDVHLPDVNPDLDNQELGRRISTRWYEMRPKIPHIPYALRHAYAVRMIGKQDLSRTARWMGHGLDVHVKTYHTAISEWEDQQAFEEMKRTR